MGGSIHGAWSAMFVIAAEITVKERWGVAGAVLNAGKTKHVN